jgi:hypothetical protein
MSQGKTGPKIIGDVADNSEYRPVQLCGRKKAAGGKEDPKHQWG